MSQITKTMNFAHLVAPIDSTGVTKTTDELSFENYKHISFLIPIGNLAADATLTIEECTSAAGAGNAAMAFNYRVCGAAGGATEDTWDALTAVASTGLTLANGADDGKMFIVEIDDFELSAGFGWVRAILAGGAGATLCNIIGICSESRHSSAVMTSAIS